MLVGTCQVAGKPRLRGFLQPVTDGSVEPVLPDRELSTCKVAIQAAERFVPFDDDMFVRALERNALQAPDPQVVAATCDDIVVGHEG